MGGGTSHAPPAPSALPPLPHTRIVILHSSLTQATVRSTGVPLAGLALTRFLGHTCPSLPPPRLSRTVSDSECRRKPKEWRRNEEGAGVGEQGEWVRAAPGQCCSHRQAGPWTVVRCGCALSERPRRPRAARSWRVCDSYHPPFVVGACVCVHDRMVVWESDDKGGRGFSGVGPKLERRFEAWIRMQRSNVVAIRMGESLNVFFEPFQAFSSPSSRRSHFRNDYFWFLSKKMGHSPTFGKRLGASGMCSSAASGLSWWDTVSSMIPGQEA